MAETYTDASGNVFPLNAYGRPQGYWKNNKYIFPKFGTQTASAVPTVDPVQPVVQPSNPYRLPRSVAEQQQDSEGDYPTQLGGVPGGGAASNIQGSSAVAPSHGPISYTGGLFGGASGVNPAVMQGLGGRLGAMSGIPGAGLFGSVAGGLAGGRGGRGIAGDVIGTGLGTLALGPIGGLLGIVGGRMGDVSDMENVLNMGKSGQRGFWDTLGYGLGLGDSLQDQLSDYYGINQAGIDPFGASMGHPTGLSIDEDDIGDDVDMFTPEQQLDAFDAIADAFGGDDPDDASMDSSSDDNTFGYGIF
jgi:hypothetical protein